MKDQYANTAMVKKGYRDQLIYYYNNINKKSEIAGAMITESLISIIEKRYGQLGGSLPISVEDILKERGKGWELI